MTTNRKYRVTVMASVQTGPSKFATMSRTATLPFVPRVGDYLCADTWGFTFSDEGAKVETVAVGLEDGEITVWVADDHETWKDVAAGNWATVDEMISECYTGFSRKELLA